MGLVEMQRQDIVTHIEDAVRRILRSEMDPALKEAREMVVEVRALRDELREERAKIAAEVDALRHLSEFFSALRRMSG